MIHTIEHLKVIVFHPTCSIRDNTVYALKLICGHYMHSVQIFEAYLLMYISDDYSVSQADVNIYYKVRFSSSIIVLLYVIRCVCSIS